MDKPIKAGITNNHSMFLKISRSVRLAGQAVNSSRLRRRAALAFGLAVGICLMAINPALAVPTLIHEDGVNYSGNGVYGSTTLNDFPVSGGSNRMLIVAVADESTNPVDSVMLTTPAPELLTNPGFEDGLTGWTNSGGTADVGTGCWACDDPPHGGSNQAYWQSSNNAYYLYQNVNLTSYAGDIDAGNAVVTATGWLISNEYPSQDLFYMQVRFYDGADPATSNEITGDRYDTGTMDVATWAQYGLTEYTIPTGARSLQVRFNTWEDCCDAGSADDFSVKVGINGSIVSESLQKVGEQITYEGANHTTSMWVLMDADLPADGSYDITASGGAQVSIAAMLWSGLRQDLPMGSATGESQDDVTYQTTISTTVTASEADSLVVGTSGHGSEGTPGWLDPPAPWTRRLGRLLAPASAWHGVATRVTSTAGNVQLIETNDGQYNRAAQFVAAFAPALDGPPGCPTCGFSRSITIPPTSLGDSCTGDVTDLPVLIAIEGDNNLKLAAGKVQSSYGYDIAFIDSSGNALYHDLERYDGILGTVVAWVKVPTLSTSADTVIYMVYGDSSVSAPTAVPEAVWSSGYRGVWHMKESPGGPSDIKDSTSNDNHGTSNNMAGNRLSGKIGYALDFDGTSDYISVPDDGSLDITAEITLEAWVNLQDAGIDQKIVGKTGPYPQQGFLMGARGGVMPEMWDDSGTLKGFSGGTISSNQWQHLVVTWKPNSDQITYINGSEVRREPSGTRPLGTNNDPLIIGAAPWNPDTLEVDGILDEVRVSSVVRDACWLETEYGNQNDPGSFYILGNEEQLGQHAISATAQGDGVISPAGFVPVVEGTDKTFTITPDNGYKVSEVFVDTISITPPTDGQYTFSNVTADHSIFVTFEAVTDPFGWSVGDFDYRKQISISSAMLPAGSCSSSLTNYPVLIKVENDNELKAHAQSNGYDIVFKLGDGTPLNHEVEAYDAATGSLVAWVRIPSLSNTTDTNIYIYYGNELITSAQGTPSYVWDFANYEGVWHLNESPANDVVGGHKDSTSNAFHGTALNFDGTIGTTAATGLMAGADKFAPAGQDLVSIPDAPELNPPGDMTVEAWINFNSFKGSDSEGIVYKNNNTDPWLSFKLAATDDRRPMVQWNNTSASWDTAIGAAGSLNPGTWYYMVATHDGNSLRIYVNGTLVGSDPTSGSMLDSPGSLNIGSEWSGGNSSPDAVIDEVRISAVARSVCWIQTSYNNLLNPGAYITVGGEEGQGATHTIIASAGTGGSISPLGSVTVAEGSDKTFTVSPASGYRVDAVLVDDGAATLTGNQYTFTNVTGAHSIEVTFVLSDGEYGWDGGGDFLYRRPLVIDGARLGDSCSSDLTSFPVLVQIASDPDLMSVSVSGHVSSQLGDDIVFKSASDVVLPHELTHYDKLTGALTAWVRVPALTKDENHTIYMYYGNASIAAPTENPAAVWDVNYVGVWHLNEAPDDDEPGHLDSTSYNNIGTPKNFDDGGGGFTDATGKIGGANYFKGDDDWVEVPSSASLDITGDQITLSAWVNSSVDQNDSAGFAVKSNGNNYNYQLGIRYNDQGNFRVRTNGSSISLNAGPALAQNQWYFIYGIYNGYTAKLYLNGVEQGSLDRTGNIESAGTAPLVIGRRALGDPRFFDGIIDEVRVSNTSRSTCWMETEYSNQNDPAAFISLGAEEAEGAVFTITASAGTNGSISPAGTVTVADGGAKNFFLVADEGYQVNTVAIGGSAAQSYAGAQYLFTNVAADTSIEVTFKAVVVEPPPEEEVPPGCAKNLTIDYGSGFDIANLNTVNTGLDASGYVKLNTGNQAIDPNNIVIPFQQEVAVYFLYEGAGYDENDFGWMLAADGVDGTKHEIYQDVNDTNDNGMLDLTKSVVTDRYGDINGDGTVNALDTRQVIGTFNAGTELAFYLKVDDDEYVEAYDYGDSDDKVYFYTKTAWNQDTYRGDCSEDPLLKTYYLGRGMPSEGECIASSNWMAQKALTRAGDIFGLNFGYDDTATLTINQGQRFAHVMVGAPANQPNAWVLGWEDLVGAGDTDHNDMVFIIERETGGTVQLKPEAAISPADADGNINGVTIGVYDYMPGGSCLGQIDIAYYLSIDAGDNWVEVTGWDEVYDFTLVGDGRKFLGAEVTNWTPGAPPYTYRTRRVDFAGLGLSGNELIWRADFKSQEEGCEPKLIDLSLDLTVSTAGHIARSTPTVLANVLYSGSMETPAVDWTSDELRGHLKCTQIYDPADPSQTSTLELWDAGDVLKNQMDPDDRNIYTPNVTVQVVDAGSAQQLAVGDGVTTTFSGRLANYPALATTVRITDQRETFADQHTDDLDGSLGGSGWINRFTGEYRITFNDAPSVDQPITATYSYFTYNAGAMRPFIPLNVTNAELGIDSTYLIPGGYIYDFNGVSPITDADGDWLVEWVRGYKDGSTKSIEKEWVLGAVDHSVPAVATPPAASPWYYGTAFPEDKIGSDNDRKGYRTFRDAQVNRRTVVYVGARDGMLHAFDAGAFGWTDDDNDTAVDEYRGLFDWTDLSASSPAWCADVTDCPDYGTGRELWAFIPANLLPRLKNNYLQGDDQAYVDASPALADVFVNGAWRTVLLSAEGNGGDTVFCLDVTVPDAPQFMWEFADPELFRSRSSPSVAQIGRIYYNGTTKWVAFFVSGKTYDDTLYPSIYVIDIADGSVVEKIVLDAEAAGAGGVLSGQPTIVDSDGNGYVDRLYIGSDKGLLYKINMPDDPDTVKYGINHCVINTDFTDTDTNEVPDAWHYQPIYGSPTVVAGNSVDLYGKMTYDIRIFFGTGDSPYYDEDINFADTRYFFYAYRDTTDKGVCDTTQVALDWFFQLPEGHRIWASAFAAAGNIYFGTSTGDVEDPCDMSGNSGSGFDANAGKLFAFNINNPNDGPILERVVGNVLAAPVVEDKHLYVQSVGGDIDSFGSGQYNSKVKKGGIPQIQIHWWREIF